MCLCFSSWRVNEAKIKYSYVLRWLHPCLGAEVMVRRDSEKNRAFHTAQSQEQQRRLPEPGTQLCVSRKATAGKICSYCPVAPLMFSNNLQSTFSRHLLPLRLWQTFLYIICSVYQRADLSPCQESGPAPCLWTASFLHRFAHCNPDFQSIAWGQLAL